MNLRPTLLRKWNASMPFMGTRFTGGSAASLLLAVLLLTIGCSHRPPVDSTYGRREVGNYGGSVNGTSVLSDMFEQNGAKISTTRFLGRLVDRANVVVWFPDEFDIPPEHVRSYFLDWLIAEPNRTLIYVGRDFDAEVAYFDQLASRSETDAAMEYRRRAALARSVYDDRVSILPDSTKCPWFEIDRTIVPRQAKEFTGPWSESLIAADTNIWVNSRFVFPEDSDEDAYDWQCEPLLESGDDVIAADVTRTLWNDSRIIVISNGSWLLNMPLVNHQHRKLAGRLIESCGTATDVVFLESQQGGPQVADNGPRQHHGVEAFTVWPVNVVLLHLTAAGMFYCFAVFPIFGRAKRLPARDNSDFGRHITALGELLERTGDAEYALKQISQFQHMSGEVPKHDITSTSGNPFAPSPAVINQHSTAASQTAIPTTDAESLITNPSTSPPSS